MRESLVAFLALLITSSAAFPGGVGNPAYEYALGVIQEHDLERFNFWRGANEQPPGGMIARFSYDITNDGKDDLFLGSTIGDGGWTLYVWTPSGFSRSPEGIYLNGGANGFIKKVPNGVELTSVTSTLQYLSESKYVFGLEGLLDSSRVLIDGYEDLIEIRGASSGEKPDWLIRRYGEQLFFDAEIISLQRYLSGDRPVWLPFDRDVALVDQPGALSREAHGRQFPVEFSPEIALGYSRKLSTSPGNEEKEDVERTINVVDDGGVSRTGLATPDFRGLEEEGRGTNRALEEGSQLAQGSSRSIVFLFIGLLLISAVLVVALRYRVKARLGSR